MGNLWRYGFHHPHFQKFFSLAWPINQDHTLLLLIITLLLSVHSCLLSLNSMVHHFKQPSHPQLLDPLTQSPSSYVPGKPQPWLDLDLPPICTTELSLAGENLNYIDFCHLKFMTTHHNWALGPPGNHSIVLWFVQCLALLEDYFIHLIRLQIPLVSFSADDLASYSTEKAEAIWRGIHVFPPRVSTYLHHTACFCAHTLPSLILLRTYCCTPISGQSLHLPPNSPPTSYLHKNIASASFISCP